MNRDRIVQIDILKGLAIISVILLHSWDTPFLLLLGAPYHIMQAVPIFIIITAYNGVNSYVRANAITLTQCYNSMTHRFNRLIVPYSAAILFEYLLIIFVNSYVVANVGVLASSTGLPLETIQAFIYAHYSYPHLFSFVVTGGYGPGSYFVPVLISLILISPILYILARKNLLFMLFVAFILDITFEAYSLRSSMPDWMYRLLFIRYLFAFGLGIWLAFGIDQRWLAVGGIISAIYITAVNYLGYVPLAHPSWSSQNALSFVWPLVLVVIGLTVAPETINNIYTLLISDIGKASYHIFLTQMVYFWAIGAYVNRFTASFIINSAVCISVGLIFYYSSKVMVRKIKN